MENKSKELEIAIKAALEAGKILEKYFETEILKEFKEDDSIVTKADSESEELIKKIILEAFPEHSILAEETGHTDNGGKYVWHVDPIDGTRNFANGLPFFAVSIALLHENQVLVAVVYNPITRSLFIAEKGKGSYLNNKRIFVSKDGATRAILAAGKSRKLEDRRLFRNLIHYLPKKISGMTVRDMGVCSLDLAYVATGAFEVSVQIGLRSYDFAAGTLLIQEAGGKITKFDGSPWEFPGNYFIASNGVFHEEVIAEIKNQKETLNI
ncbi:MAG: inositol monophosphatase [bacterium]|nr:inositol monophosphatase [bacterium]